MFANKKYKERLRKFWKLKQLDRIEYLLHFKTMREDFSPFSPTVTNMLFILNITLFLFGTLFLIAFKSVALLQITPKIFYISIWLIGVSIFLDIIINSSKTKAIFKLRERFNLN